MRKYDSIGKPALQRASRLLRSTHRHETRIRLADALIQYAFRHGGCVPADLDSILTRDDRHDLLTFARTERYDREEQVRIGGTLCDVGPNGEIPAYSVRGEACAQCGKPAFRLEAIPFCLDHDQRSFARTLATRDSAEMGRIARARGLAGNEPEA